MLPVFGPSVRLCQGKTRREAMRIGALGLGGLTLPNLLRAEQAAGVGSNVKSVIMIYLVGAPPHQDMYDLKMDAPSEIRGVAISCEDCNISRLIEYFFNSLAVLRAFPLGTFLKANDLM